MNTDPSNASGRGAFQPTPITPVDTLHQLAHQVRQARNVSKRRQPTQREHRAAVEDEQVFRERFASVLTRWVDDPELQSAWRAYLQNEGPAPSGPDLPPPPLFKGMSASGARLEILPAADEKVQLVVDGKPSVRAAGAATLGDRPVECLQVDGQDYHEVFESPSAAVEALVAYVRDPERGAPWTEARELYADGLVDAELSLTPRGQRLVNGRRGDAPAARVVL